MGVGVNHSSTAQSCKERAVPERKIKAVFPVQPDSDDDERKDSDADAALTYSETEDVLLPEHYRPTKCDVINGRGKKSYNNVANRRFRQLTAMNLKRYQTANCKVDKTLVVIEIVNSIRQSSPCGGFIKKCLKTGRWISMSDEAAREKVGHCLRDMIASHRDDQRQSKPQSFPEEIRTAQSNQHVQMELLANAASLHSRFQNIPTTLPSLSKNKTVTAKKSSKKAKKSPAKAKKVAATKGTSAVSKSFKSAPRPPPGATSSPQIPSQIASTFNNFDALSAARGNYQEMSLQQRNILSLLESGFKGSVEDLLRAAR